MHPRTNVIFINLSLLAIVFLFLGGILKYWFIVPPVVCVITALNLVFVGVFSISDEKKLMQSFLAGFLVMVVATAAIFAAYYLFFPEHLHGFSYDGAVQ